MQRACCIRNSARITGKNLATLKRLGVLANSEEFRVQLMWARDHPHSQEAKSLNAKVSQILSMVGSTIPYSPFERAVTRPKLNAMRYCYGVGSNFINETSIRMHMAKQQPFLEAQNFHHKLQILLEAIIGCKTSSETRQSHDYFQYD